jgi:RNA polymerase sigma-70 factor (ECF subfamily)
MGDRVGSRRPAKGMVPDTEARLLEQIRSGDAEAGRRFVREQYPSIYRYLIYLTNQRELAADLTQETFLQAWRHLDTFEGRASLRTWLHRIAHREFLETLRRRRAEAPLDETPEAAAPDSAAWLASVELRDVIDRLPLEQRAVVLLHYLEGYSSAEIARITDAPVGTVCYRLSRARERLRQALGEDDLTYLNEPLAPMRQWNWLPLDQMYALETHLAMGGRTREDLGMERREFLRQAAAGAIGLALSEPGQEVIDGRLTQKVTCAFKGTALSDLCDHLRTETRVNVSAGASVADEKVTLFCEKAPLRDVMRQLSRPFGYAWVRSSRAGEYRYELVQDLRSQLLEEELRNRDRHAALLALEEEIERYRPYLDLSPDEALARSRTAPPTEKKLLENLARFGWGPIQMYFRLSNQQLAALRGGQELKFSQEPRAGEQPLPADLTRGIFQSYRNWHLVAHDDRLTSGPEEPSSSAAPPSPSSDSRAALTVTIEESELGRFRLGGCSTLFTTGSSDSRGDSYAVGRSPGAARPDRRAANGKLASDPALRLRVTIRPQATGRLLVGDNLSPSPSPKRGGELVPLPVSGRGSGGEVRPDPWVTTADVLEAFHYATGLPIVADYYTRLYPPASVSVKEVPLFDALNPLADAMRLRWTRDGAWLQFRSASFYDDRLKEVPNRLLTRWTGSRRQHGALTLDDMVEIAQLTDAQLDAEEMAEGAREYLGLAEWDVARSRSARAHLRFLATLSPAQRREATSPDGLPLTKMSLAQQQQYLALGPAQAAREGADRADRIEGLEELTTATLRVDYTLPGWFQWGAPPAPESRSRPVIGPWPVRERTAEAALRAARRLNPEVTEAELARTELEVIFIYLWYAAKERYMRRVNQGGSACVGGW